MADNTRIEIYRANIANPADIPELRFWVGNELVKIQAGFVSADEVINAIANTIDDLVEYRQASQPCGSSTLCSAH